MKYFVCKKKNVWQRISKLFNHIHFISLELLIIQREMLYSYKREYMWWYTDDVIKNDVVSAHAENMYVIGSQLQY